MPLPTTDSIQIRSQRLGSPRTSPEQRSKTGNERGRGRRQRGRRNSGTSLRRRRGRRAAIQPDRARARDARGGAHPARPAREDRGDHAAHRGRGHQVRVLPAGLRHRPRDGQGRRLVVLLAGGREGLPAGLRRDREPVHGPLRRLHRVRPRGVRAGRDGRPRHVRGAAVGSARRARLLRLLRHGDGRAARRRPAAEPQADRARVRDRARPAVPDRHRARDDVAQEAGAGRDAGGRHQAVLLPHPPVRGAPSGAHGRGRLRAAARPRHVLRRPRGRPRPARAELPLRPPGPDGRQHHDVPPGLRRGRPQARPPADLHAQAVHGRERERPPPPLHALRRPGQERLPRPERPRPAVRTSRGTSSAACSSTSTR